MTQQAEKSRSAVIAERAMRDTVDYLVAQGYSMTPAQAAASTPRLMVELAKIPADLPEGRLDTAVCATCLLVLGEALGIIVPAVDPIALGLELAEVGANAATARILAGGYPEFTEAQRREVITAVRKLVVRLLEQSTPKADAVERVCAFAATAVDLVLGEAPLRKAMN